MKTSLYGFAPLPGYEPVLWSITTGSTTVMISASATTA
jgi:hypothetical protein